MQPASFPLLSYLGISVGLSSAITSRLAKGQLVGMPTAELDQVLMGLHEVPSDLIDQGLHLRRLVGRQLRDRASDFEASAQKYRGQMYERPLITPEELQLLMDDFTSNRLSVDWRSFPYPIPSSGQVDPRLTTDVWAHRERINHRCLSDAALRDPRTRILCSLAPIDDFHYSFEHEGQRFSYDGYDFYHAETFVNPPREQLRGASPSYAMNFLEASLPPERGARFVVPDDFEAFQREFGRVKPDLLLLSGIGKNTRVLLRMALYARQHGAKEVWLGNYAALDSLQA